VEDHVFVAGESLDKSAGLGCEGAAVAVVGGGAFGECAQVVVADLCEDDLVEVVGVGSAGVVWPGWRRAGCRPWPGHRGAQPGLPPYRRSTPSTCRVHSPYATS
jgi:hypothetical protein